MLRKSIKMNVNRLCCKLTIVAFTLQVLVSIAFAEEILTLEKCINLALANNQDLKIAQKRILESKGRKQETFGNFLPKLSASGSYTKLKESPRMSVLFGGIEQTFELGPDYLYSTQLTLRQPLFAWWKIYHADEQARLNYGLVNEEYKEMKNSIIFDVKKAFYNLLLARQFVVIAEEAVNVTDTHYKTTRALYKEGRVSDYDVSRAKVQLVNNQTKLIKARNNLKLAREELLLLLNTELEEDWKIKGDFPREKREVSLQDAMEKALRERSEIRQLMIQEKVGKVSIKLARAENRPNLDFLANYEYTNPFYNKEEWGEAWNVILSLNFPLFSGLSDLGRVNQAKAGLEQVKILRNQVEQRIKLEVKKAIFDMEEARERIEAQEENVKLARANLRIAQERYRQGLMSEIELRDAQLSLTQAETDYFQALYDHNVAGAFLDRAIGKYQ
ncbi:TolC family protein [bacterium]|nr:TolC family protein [bacterium]NIN91855.1 TolC family protein [bacterium]NIO18129.1 TolC family protein [bacterium]NIO73101.1 TolC family protein [bacterium]